MNQSTTHEHQPAWLPTPLQHPAGRATEAPTDAITAEEAGWLAEADAAQRELPEELAARW